MRHRKQNNRKSLDAHRQEYQRNMDTIHRLTAKNKNLEAIITEEENLEVVGFFRSSDMTLDEFLHAFQTHASEKIAFPADGLNTSGEDAEDEEN